MTTLIFESGTTTTVTNFTATGSTGNPLTINSTIQGTQAYLVKVGGGTVNVNYAIIKDSAASPSNTWYADVNSADIDDNSGWIFAYVNEPIRIGGNIIVEGGIRIGFR